MQPAEDELVRRAGTALQSTVMMVPHHGSRTSSSARFLASVAPRWAVVSARDHGKQLYPHASVVERYRRLGCRLLRTEHQGAICMRTDGRNLRIEPFVGD
jgi:competence protein ComEC